MEQLLRQRAESIWTAAIRSVLPDEAVRRALEHFHPQGRVFLVAAGKAAWQMAHAALAVLGRVDGGIVITKYGHVRGPLPGVTCCEAGHPVPDDNSFAATQRALALVSGLRADDTVLFLLSGGGSALFEKPLLPADELQAITQALLACGADIVEINTIRKRLSAVKGGRFALACAPDLRAGRCHCGKIPADALPRCRGPAAAGNAQNAAQRDHKNHRQRAGAVPRRCGRLPRRRVRAGFADRLPLL